MALFPFFSRKPTEPPAPVAAPVAKTPPPPHPLDAVTGGVFSATSSAQRLECVSQWLASNPEPALLQQVYKALSASDKGAAKPIRQRMNDIRQSNHQEEASQDWAAKAEKILSANTFHIADGMAWLRDAAKAGAPLSKEPLSELRSRIADQIKALEELQHKTMVQKEAAVLLAQRIDVLSTKPWQQAAEAATGLAQDVQKWNSHAGELVAAPLWSSVEPRHANAIESSRVQLTQVFEAFSAALEQAKQAAEDPKAPLPQVQVWADELRALHGLQSPADHAATAATMTPEQQALVTSAIKALETTIKQGQSKQSSQAAAALRDMLKEMGGSVDAELERRINRALIDAGDLQGWQRWGANQVREELIARAEGLTQPSGDQAPQGNKTLQTQVRELHEQWRQVDRSSPPNGHLWKRFDEAMSKAREIVDEWLKKVKAEAQAHKSERQTVIDEVRAFAASLGEQVDLKALQRQLQQFSNRWRNAGHVNDKVFGQLQSQWKEVYELASAPLEQARKYSADIRRSLIEEAKDLGARAQLDIRAIKTLQQRWQSEAQSVPLDRKLEQKLWDAFRQPLDQAFQRKDTQRNQAEAAASVHDQAVLSAAQAVEEAIAAGHAQAIRDAMDALQVAVRTAPAAPSTDAAVAEPVAQASVQTANTEEAETSESVQNAESETDSSAVPDTTGTASEVPAAEVAPAAPSVAPKVVIAVRGDDRPGASGSAKTAATRESNTRDGRRPSARDGRDDRRNGHDSRQQRDRAERPALAPRLGDRAFRAQRNAMDNAQAALRKLSAQAHGEAVTQLLDAWKSRSADALPAQAQISKRVSGPQWNNWKTAIGQPAASNDKAAEAVLRLEMAAEVPTPADFMGDRRTLQLQLLTQKNAASPSETWVNDLQTVLATPADDTTGKRLQSALKVLLKR
ncbi:DUF349 domain-containing protein [Lampropedia puyangensis]|uniref:DUF349 domain-containing protein n=1 Tax=Lampropedia puyangensis TaxID=1330072 RepID=A0A4S8EVN3_9BURK|nr:DUF349 domain-containing protein [Lampropedia puyangensis]THT97834.1 DUF349 domain-containing protein [Lampropedia puyangensis]